MDEETLRAYTIWIAREAILGAAQSAVRVASAALAKAEEECDCAKESHEAAWEVLNVMGFFDKENKDLRSQKHIDISGE
jgi:hypothetical protein